LTTNVLPSDGLNGTRIQIANPEIHLGPPGLLSAFIDFRIQAVD